MDKDFKDFEIEEDDDLYRDIILEHSTHPPHRGKMANPTHYDEGINASCGDEVEIFLQVRDGVIQDIKYEGVGCTICMASASMLTQLLRGKQVGSAQEFYQAFKAWITARDPKAPTVDLEDLEALGGVRNYPLRLKCALLAWETFAAAMGKELAQPKP